MFRNDYKLGFYYFDMKVVIGYGIAIFGLAILALGAGDFDIPILSWFSNSSLSIVAMVLIAGGVVLILVFSDKRGRSNKYEGKRHSKNGGKIQDLPVYEGDSIIAYRRD